MRPGLLPTRAVLSCAGWVGTGSRPAGDGSHAHLEDPFTPKAAETIGMDIVKAQKLLGALAEAIGGAPTVEPLASPAGREREQGAR